MNEANIIGPTDLTGTVRIQGSKNAAQKLIPSTVLYPGRYTLHNVPNIHDSNSQLEVLSFLGGLVKREGSTIYIDTRGITSREIPPEITARSSGTFLFAGALLSRFGQARVFHPGGDAIGPRAVTWHLDAFRTLGATVKVGADHYEATATRMKASEIVFKKPTVNGTVNAILASARCEGTTVLRNTPNEPDIDNTVELLNKAGAQITIEDRTIEIHGSVIATGSATVDVIPDRNDAATFAIAAALLRGPITLSPINQSHLAPLLDIFTTLHIKWNVEESPLGPALTVERISPLSAISVESALFPKFSTDWGPMMQVLMTQMNGTSVFHETIFSDRFKHVEHLARMGANIEFFQPPASPAIYNFDVAQDPEKPHGIRIVGPSKMHGSAVEATDVRAGAALVLAGLAAGGRTTVRGYDHVQRGYQDFAERLRLLGADISLAKDDAQ